MNPKWKRFMLHFEGNKYESANVCALFGPRGVDIRIQWLVLLLLIVPLPRLLLCFFLSSLVAHSITALFFFVVSHFFYNQHSSESCEQQGKLGIQIGDITGFHQHQQQIQQKKNHTKCGQIKWVNKTAKWNENIRNEKLLRKIENSTEKKQHFQRKKKRWIFSFACQFINLLICFVCHVIIPVASNSCRWYKLLLSLQLWS